MWIAYQILYGLLALLLAPWLVLWRGKHYLSSLAPRLGRIPESSRRTQWIHAVSVGEVGVAASLIPILPSDRPLAVSTVTPSGQERARKLFAGASVTYLPFELGFAVRRFFDRLDPASLILCEGDYWPLVLREVRRRGVRAVVVNGRVSERSFRRMMLIRRLVAPLLEPIAGFAVQTELDGERLRQLGVAAHRITVTGNLKFETGVPAELPDLARAVRRLAGGRPILVAGSTMRGEEEQVVEAFERLGGGDRALLILAPRHPERWPRVVAALSKSPLSVIKRSDLDLDLDVGAGAKDGGERPDLLVLDSLGELAAVYAWAAATFIGGTLVPTGGHNPIEAACHGAAIAAGPSMENFREIAERFDEEDAWRRVESSADLGRVWDEWLARPELAAQVGQRAARLTEASQGALAKTRRFLETHLAEATGT